MEATSLGSEEFRLDLTEEERNEMVGLVRERQDIARQIGELEIAVARQKGELLRKAASTYKTEYNIATRGLRRGFGVDANPDTFDYRIDPETLAQVIATRRS